MEDKHTSHYGMIDVPVEISARHWLVDHMQRELEDIEAERLTMGQVTIITTFAKRDVASCYKALPD